MSDETYPPANTDAELEPIAKQFVDGVRSQILKADAAGADDDDYCVMLPVGFFALILQMPIIALPNRHDNETPRRVALTTKMGANALVKNVIRESGLNG